MLSCGIYSFGALDFDIEFASTLGIKFNPASWIKFRKNHVMKLTWQPIFKCGEPINSAP